MGWLAEWWLIPVAWCILILAGGALAIAILAFQRSVDAQIEVRALQKSTHQVQFVPLEDEPPGRDREAEALAKELDKDEQLGWDALRMSSDEPLS